MPVGKRLCRNAQQYLQPGLQSYICWGSARWAKPLVEHLARQPMLRGQLSWLYDELVKALRFVQYLLAAAEAIYG